MPIFVYQRTKDGNPRHPWQQWISFGARPEIFFTKYLSLAFEGGVDHTTEPVAPPTMVGCVSSPSHHKLEQDSKFFSRPVLRAFLTYANWSDGFRGFVGGIPFQNRTERAYLRSAGGNLVVGRRTKNGNSRHNDELRRRLQTTAVQVPARNYTRPLAIVTTLFFMWGFLTCLNDILVPHLKSIFDLSYARVMLVQFAFFSAYFLFSIPWSKIVNAIGYQKTMVAGLLCMAVGAFLFVPAASVRFIPAVPGGADRARRGHHRLAGSGQSLRGGPRKAGNRFEPLGPDPGV